MTKLQKLNGFILKVLAMAFMTIDHVGLFLMMFNLADSPLGITGYVLRCIGRVAFPLFVLLLVEGIRHSSSVRNYLIRIGILAGALMLSEIIIYYFIDSAIGGAESPLIDLLLCGLTLGLLHRKDKWSFFAILPIVFIILATGIQIYEKTTALSVVWFPFYIRPGYSLFALLLSLGFYFAHPFVDNMYKKNEMDVELFKDTPQYRLMINVAQSSILFAVNILIFALSYISYNNVAFLDIFTASVQTWSIAAIIFILFYNGKRGYNSVWFKYFCYAYFPVHIVIIFAIFYVIYML